MENDFEKRMEHLKTPDTTSVKHQEALKIGLVSAKKSSRIGFVFIIIPALFILVAFLKLKFLMSIDFTLTFESLMKADHLGSMEWIIPVVFLLLPMLAIIINLLAVTHFNVNKETKELTISIRYRFRNLIVLVISLAIIIAFWSIMIIGYIHFK
jgi:lantibiotic transport system permease protein